MGQEKITDPREEGTLVSLDKQMILISCEGERRNPVSGLGRWIAQYHILTRTHLYEGVEKKDNYFHLDTELLTGISTIGALIHGLFDREVGITSLQGNVAVFKDS